MASKQQHKKKQGRKQQPKGSADRKSGSPSATANTATGVPGASATSFGVGVGLLAVAIGASLMLVLQSLGSLALPGCGPESGCARAASSVWGSVPGLGWPTSHVGMAYFVALLVAWVACRGGVPSALRWIVRAGVAGSVVLLVAMVAGGYLCAYCLAVHVANIAFLVLVERMGHAPVSATRPVVAVVTAFVVATGVLAIFQFQQEAAAVEKDEKDLVDSTTAIIQGTDAQVFTGRYRHGPEAAPIRVVILSDYQCPDCQRIEGELQEILAERDDISFSAKHFPFCVDCNRFAAARNFNPHPNACWAARAAETAGILGGNDGFWKMHHWLFDRGGSFTGPELNAALPGLGFDAAEFVRVMQTQETLDLVQADIEEGLELGLYFTPMIFINGVELKGWRLPGALRKTIDQVAATNPEPLTAEADRPPGAIEKHLADWRESPRRVLAPDTRSWSIGAAEPAAEVVIWGDYQEPFTSELDTRIRAIMAGMPEARYTFRHYPFDQSCNAQMTSTKHPLACRAAQAAEAAGSLGGPDAYWKMHEWLMANQKEFSDETLSAAATQMGLDATALMAEMNSMEVADAIREDTAAGKRAGLRSIPYMFVNGQAVPRWRMEGGAVPERIIAEAAGIEFEE